MLLLLMAGIYVCSSDGPGWHDIHTKFHDDRVRYLSNIESITSIIREGVVLVLLKEGFMKQVVQMASGGMIRIHTKFHDDWYRRYSNIKVLPRQFETL
jgi:hypothetical protein